MFGITVADAVLVGTLLISLLAAWRGSKDGGEAARGRPPSPETAILGATLVDTSTFRDVADALREVVAAIREHLAYLRANDTDRMTELLEEISRKLEPPPAPPPRHRHTRHRGG